MQIYADVLDAEITLAESDQACGLGAAILGCAAAGLQPLGPAVHAMARQRNDVVYRPNAKAVKSYAKLYQLYLSLAQPKGELAAVMRQMRELK